MFLRLVICLLATSVLIWADADGVDSPATPPPPFCPAGGPIGAINLRVKPPSASSEPLPLEKINSLSEGDTVLYSPIVRGREVRHGEVALVLVPAKKNEADPIFVTDPKPAEKPQEWKVDQTMSVAAYVYGPAGLSKKKVKGFLSQDDLLIAQLADYAEKTAQVEALMDTLSNSESSAASVNAALSGFASQYGLSGLDKTAPASMQAQVLFATMNPQLSSYDPLNSTASARIGQTASLTTAAAALFFGSPIGLAAGGTAMLLDLRSIAFPGTQFRSSFAQPMNPGLNLCGQRTPTPPHTRVAYIWATRIPNAPVPNVQTGAAHFIPEGQKTAVPVDMPDAAWHYIDRARDWALEDAQGHRTAIKVVKLANQKSLELDLTKASVRPGEYTLGAYWDWVHFTATGPVAVRPLSSFEPAKLEASSQDRLLAETGKIPVTLEGDDFEFTTKVEIKKLKDEFATPAPVPFALPKGAHMGPQSHMDVQIDTSKLDSGDYELLIAQQDGKSHPVNVKVLDSPPEIANLPILANQGASQQHFVLKGRRLGLLAKLEAPGVNIHLDPAAESDTERNVTVQVTSDVKPGSAFAISEYLRDRNEPVLLADALRITGPLPVIASSKVSLPSGLPVTLNQGEFPAGNALVAVLDVKNIQPSGRILLGCAGDSTPAASLRIGEQSDKWSVQQLSPDQIFISYDTSSLPAGCDIEATIDDRGSGRSEPYPLARLLRLPAVEQFTASSAVASDGTHTFTLMGRNLEMIQKAGWDQLTGYDVRALPAPVAGAGLKQSLQINLPAPPTPTAALYVWLRGDTTGRPTNIVLTTPAQ